jgi:signal transduction histidine kinase
MWRRLEVRWNLSIRTKLLVLMASLLVLSTSLSFFLQHKQGEMLRGELKVVVNDIVRRLLEETLPGEMLRGEGVAFRGQGGAPREPEPRRPQRTAVFRRLEIAGPLVTIGPEFVVALDVAEGERNLYPYDQDRFLDLDTLGRRGVIPPETVRRISIQAQDPIEKARRQSLPRELCIAGGVLLAGLGLSWLFASRLTRPLKDLTAKMEAVARGDLQVKVTPTTSDEVRQMSIAFNTMVDSLREKRELEQKMFQAERLTSIGNLAAGVAHDIRNPLNTIGLALSHLVDSYRPAAPAEREGYGRLLGDIKREVARLNELVRNFLSLAHADRGEKVPSSLAAIVEETLRLFRKEAESKGVQVETRLEPVEPMLLDPQLVRRAFTNVVLNALRAMEPDGGTLTIALERRGGPSGEVMLSVADTGCGIEPGELDRIFLPYYTTHPEGTGLGLPIARGALEAHGGRIEVSSRPGAGTRVELIFPAAAPVARSPAPAGGALLVDGGGGR